MQIHMRHPFYITLLPFISKSKSKKIFKEIKMKLLLMFQYFEEMTKFEQ